MSLFSGLAVYCQINEMKFSLFMSVSSEVRTAKADVGLVAQ